LQAQGEAAQGMDASAAGFAGALRQQFAPRLKLLLMPIWLGKHRRLRFGGMESEIQQILTSSLRIALPDLADGSRGCEFSLLFADQVSGWAS
jgi:hypothetical protein